MTEENKQETTENNERREPTLEEIRIIKSEMLKMFQSNYKKFIEAIRELPIHPVALSQAFLYFDTGSLWMKEVIEYSPLVQKEPAPIQSSEVLQ